MNSLYYIDYNPSTQMWGVFLSQSQECIASYTDKCYAEDCIVRIEMDDKAPDTEAETVRHQYDEPLPATQRQY